MQIMQIICKNSEKIKTLDAEEFCIWISVPDDLIIKPFIHPMYESGEVDQTFEITETDYKTLVPGTDFVIQNRRQ